MVRRKWGLTSQGYLKASILHRSHSTKEQYVTKANNGLSISRVGFPSGLKSTNTYLIFAAARVNADCTKPKLYYPQVLVISIITNSR